MANILRVCIFCNLATIVSFRIKQVLQNAGSWRPEKIDYIFRAVNVTARISDAHYHQKSND